METITVQIGNSDDKLSQGEWAKYVSETDELIRRVGKVHFFGGSPNWHPWQNAAWVFVVEDEHFNYLKSGLVDIRLKFNQESVAITTGDTEFI